MLAGTETLILCGFAGLFDGNVVAPIGHEMSYFNYQSKRIYDSEQGLGKPVVFLHGDTASSKMKAVNEGDAQSAEKERLRECFS